jgi:ribA/ribD-fused uncharacterized protein
MYPSLPHEIKFYEKDAEFYEFTNFWECDHLNIDGRPWRTSEHYFQAMKFAAYPQLVEQCRTLATPRECFDMARDPLYQPYQRDDWHRGYPLRDDVSVKDQVMYNAVMTKFTQDPTLKALLMSTAAGGNPRMIIEHTDKDSYWGDGGVLYWRQGQPGNKLGQLLVRIRDEIYRNRLQGGGHGYVLPVPPVNHQLPAPPPPGARPAGPMCAWCHSKPCAAGHQYCGRTCGQSASAAGHRAPPVSPAGGGRGGGGGGRGGHHGAPHGQQHAPSHQPQQQHQVTCPAGAGPGSMITITTGNRQQLQVQVPPNVYAGHVFTVTMTTS